MLNENIQWDKQISLIDYHVVINDTVRSVLTSKIRRTATHEYCQKTQEITFHSFKSLATWWTDVSMNSDLLLHTDLL